MRKKAIFSIGILALSLITGSTFAFANPSTTERTNECPTPEQLKHTLDISGPKSPMGKPNFKVLKVAPSPINGLCEAVVKVRFNTPAGPEGPTFPQVVYVTNNQRYLVFGSIMDLKTGENLTALENQKYRRISKKLLNELKEYTAFTYYKGKSYFRKTDVGAKQYVYFITDPKCPFCHGAEPILQKWADKNSVAVRVVYDPLPIHPGSFQFTVGLVCHKKGWNSLVKAYNASKWMSQCKEGKEFVKKSIQVSSEVGVTGTPTFFNQKGEMMVGMPPNESYLNNLLK